PRERLPSLILDWNRLLERGGFESLPGRHVGSTRDGFTRTRVGLVHEVVAAKARAWASQLVTPEPLLSEAGRVPHRRALDHVGAFTDPTYPIAVLRQPLESSLRPLVVDT